MKKPLILMTILATLLIGALIYSQQRSEPFKVSGFLESDEIRIGSRVGGRVEKVLVEEGTTVKQNDVLITLEPYQLLDQKAQAEGLLAEARAHYDQLLAGFRAEEIAQSKARYDQLSATVEKLVNGPRVEDISAARSNLELAEAELDLAKLKYGRTEALLAKQAVTQADMDQVRSELKVARSTADVRREELKKLEAGTRPEELAEARAQQEEANQAWQLRKRGNRTEEIAQAKASAEAAEAALRAIQRQLDELTVRAPVDGIVDSVELRPGDLVGANTAAVSLIDPSRLWVRAYVPENRLGVQVGGKVIVTVDSFPGERFAAHVSFVSRQAEFTPGNVQTPEERSKQVFRIKVMLDEGKDRLRPGMNGDVWLGDS